MGSVRRGAFSVVPHPAQAICNGIFDSWSVSNVDDVVAENRLHPSAVVGVEFVFEETIVKGLAVSFDFDW